VGERDISGFGQRNDPHSAPETPNLRIARARKLGLTRIGIDTDGSDCIATREQEMDSELGWPEQAATLGSPALLSMAHLRDPIRQSHRVARRALCQRQLASGEPVLDDAPSHVRAQVAERLPVGDHHIVVARVTDAAAGDPHAPLVYHAGSYAGVLRD
jgi:hypothetical protein